MKNMYCPCIRQRTTYVCSMHIQHEQDESLDKLLLEIEAMSSGRKETDSSKTVGIPF